MRPYSSASMASQRSRYCLPPCSLALEMVSADTSISSILGELCGDVLAALVELSLDVLIFGTDAGVDDG